MDDRERQSRDAKRRHLERMLPRADGFHEVSRGRAGTIYYREGERVLALEWEMNAVEPGIILYLHGLDEWVLPAPEPTSAADRRRLRAALDRYAGRYRGTVRFVEDT